MIPLNVGRYISPPAAYQYLTTYPILIDSTALASLLVSVSLPLECVIRLGQLRYRTALVQFGPYGKD